MLRYKVRILARDSKCPSQRLHSKAILHHYGLKIGERVTWNSATLWLTLERKVSEGLQTRGQMRTVYFEEERWLSLL